MKKVVCCDCNKPNPIRPFLKERGGKYQYVCFGCWKRFDYQHFFKIDSGWNKELSYMFRALVNEMRGREESQDES